MNATDETARRYFKLAYHYAKRFLMRRRWLLERHPGIWDDFASAAHFGLFDLCREIDRLTIPPEKYLFIRIRYHTLKAVELLTPLGFRDARCLPGHASPEFVSAEQAYGSADVLEWRPDREVEEDGIPDLECLLSWATEKEAEALRIVYLEGLDREKTARKLGLARNAVECRLQRGMRRIKEGIRRMVAEAEGVHPASFRLLVVLDHAS